MAWPFPLFQSARGEGDPAGRRSSAAAGAPGAGRPILLVAEELDRLPDEGYTRFTLTLESLLARRRSVLTHYTPPRRGDGSAVVRLVRRTVHFARAARWPELRSGRPGVVVYASRSSITLPALARARLLGRRCHAPVAILGLQAAAGALQGRLARRMAPDLLLLPTEQACRAARAAGLRAHQVWSGVDLERFRPPRPGEREALRRSWGLPGDRRIVLHVGHLRTGRNLQLLGKLAGAEGVTVVVLASGRRGPESDSLRAELERQGVVVLTGYRPRVEEVYRLADCYVFPTTSDADALALPLSVLEALASDLPVVSTRFGALAERPGAGPGLELVDRPEQIPERAVALAGRRVACRALAEPYSWQAMVDRLLGILDELEHGPGPAGPVSG